MSSKNDVPRMFLGAIPSMLPANQTWNWLAVIVKVDISGKRTCDCEMNGDAATFAKSRRASR